MDLVDALVAARPGEHWTLDGETLEGLTWISSTTPPTEEELESAWQKLQQVRQQAELGAQAAREAAIAHAKSLGFTDEMIAVMYPALAV